MPLHTQRVILSSLAAAVRNPPGCAALVALNQPHHLPAFDRVVHLEHGKVQAVRTVAEVLATPDDPSDALSQMLRAAARGAGSVDEISGEISGELAAPAAVPDADADATPNAAADAEAKGAPKLLVEREGKRDGGYSGSIFLHYARAMGYCQMGMYAAHRRTRHSHPPPSTHTPSASSQPSPPPHPNPSPPPPHTSLSSLFSR